MFIRSVLGFTALVIAPLITPAVQAQGKRVPGCSDGPRPGCCARAIGKPHLRTGQPSTAADANQWCNRPCAPGGGDGCVKRK